MKRAILFAALIVTAVAPPATRAQNPTTIFIQNATVLTVTHGNIEHGSILIRDGKIARGRSRPESSRRRHHHRRDRRVRDARHH